MRRVQGWVRLHARVADVMLAGFVVILAQLEVWTMDDPEGPRMLVGLAALAMTVPLVWRRVAALQVAIVGMSALAISAFAWNSPDKAVFPTLVIVLSAYSVASFCDLRGALVGAAVVIVPVFAHQVGVQHGLSDFVFIAVMVASVWVAGRGVRSHAARADELADHAAVVEREREQTTLAAVAEERLRIARELHDVVAHSVSLMTVQAGAERRVLEEDDSTREVLVSIEQTGRQAMTEMRRLLGMLRKGNEELTLAPQPGMEHLGVLVEHVRAGGMPVEWTVEGDPQPLPPGVDLAAYRIIQEALTNTVKHAGPATATVLVRYGSADVLVEIVDSGRGVGETENGGHGLIGMRERVALYGGEFEAGNRAGGGYAIRARLPLSSRPL